MCAVIKSVALIGMMGAGKSTVAQLLGSYMDCPVYDLDPMVAHRLGRPIPEIFSQHGESVFRTAERIVLAHLAATARPPYVLATGGGTPVDPASREILRRAFRVVWLDGSPALLFERAQSPDRPLTAGGVLAFAGLAQERRSIYEEASHLRIQTDAAPPETTAAVIAQWWKGQTDGEQG